VIRQWRHFWNTLAISGQYNPPQLVETLMLSLSMILFVVWMVNPETPYLLLGLIYTIGACASILVRESLIQSPRLRPIQMAATVLLVVSLYGCVDLIVS
jgi:hypothetical protein